MSETARIGIIGGSGWLGGAIARSLVRSGFCREQDLLLSYRSQRPEFLVNARWTSDNAALTKEADIVVVSVRPNDFAALDLKVGDKLLISVMAGVALAELVQRSGSERVVRSLPNAAAEVSRSYTPWIASAAVGVEERTFLSAFFTAFGVHDELTDEGQIEYFAALTGTGPAYPALFMDTMRRDAIENGIDPVVAERAVTTLLFGSLQLMEAHGRSPAAVVEEYIAYNGMTAAALVAMREAPLAAVLRRGFEAALQRANTLQSSA